MIGLNKRNIRVLSVTGLLLLLIFFVTQNANTVSSKQVSKPKADANALVGTHAVEGGGSSSDAQKNSVGSQIDKIKEEVGISGGDGSGNITGSKNKGQASDATPTAGSTAFDPAKEYLMILDMSPVVIFSKSYCPYSAKLKELFAQEFDFTPNYVVIELDKHEHGAELQKYIEKKTGRGTVPNVIVNGISRGGSDDLRALHSKGELLSSLKSWSNDLFTVNQIQKPSNN